MQRVHGSPLPQPRVHDLVEGPADEEEREHRLPEKRLAVGALTSSPEMRSHPKFVAGVFRKLCTSPIRADVEPHEYEAIWLTVCVALAVAAKVPPTVVHGVVG